MPPTISVTVGRLDAAAAFEAEVLEPAALLELLPGLLQAARPAARAATPAMLAILIRVGLGIEGVLLVIGGGGEVGSWGAGVRCRRLPRLRRGTPGATAATRRPQAPS